ncbi:histidine kinase OS=Streptomyces fumanus OX=67302 GN=GCM10018772_46620 PE=4 SV=1 [Streptomyces fumanus]
MLPAILMAAATGSAVAAVTEAPRTAVGWCGALATLLVIATGAEAARRGRVVSALRAEHARHSAYLERRIAGHEEEMTRIGREILPAALHYMRRGHTPREVMLRLDELDPSWPDSASRSGS